MLSLEETQTALATIVESLPEEVFIDLNGGVLLKDEIKLHPKRRANNLFILGEYHHNRTYGRYIVIYYQSLRRVFRHVSNDAFLHQVERVLKHELTHHLESRAGNRNLAKEDAQKLLRYQAKYPLSQTEQTK